MDNKRVKYTVIKDKGIVRATISGCEYDAFYAFGKKFVRPSTTNLFLNPSREHEKFLMPYQFSVVVRCHEEDEWDEEAGKKAALKKLSEKYNYSLDKHIANIYNTLNSVMEKAKTYLDDRNMLE